MIYEKKIKYKIQEIKLEVKITMQRGCLLAWRVAVHWEALLTQHFPNG